MKIAYIITCPEEEEISSQTTDSLLVKEGDVVVTLLYNSLKKEEEVVNEFIKNCKKDFFDFACILPNKSTLSQAYGEVLPQYCTDKNRVYLPLVGLYFETENDFKGVLNSAIWKPQISEELGVLTLETSLKQFDSTLYGSLIPLSILKQYSLNTELKYFSHFEFLNKLTYNGISVIGVPKLLVSLIGKDYELKTIDKEEKLEDFKKAKENYNSLKVN